MDAHIEAGAPRWRRILLRAAVVLLVLVSVGLSGFLDGSCGSSTRSPAPAMRHGRRPSYAQVLTSIDSNKVDENFNQVLDGSTGEFRTCTPSRACS